MIIFIKLRDGTELNIEDASEYGMVNDYLEIYHGQEITRINEDQIVYYSVKWLWGYSIDVTEANAIIVHILCANTQAH